MQTLTADEKELWGRLDSEYGTLCLEIGERIRELRIERGWTQLYVARQFNFYESHWRKIESGKTCSLQTLLKIAKMYGVSLSQLLEGVGPRGKHK
jgi:transcriptional regulator with XRE-family HTH domain